MGKARGGMKKLFLCMEYETPEITMSEQLRLAALRPIKRMLEINSKAGI